MWKRYARPHKGDHLGRDDWFIIRTETAADGRVTLVMVDFPAGAHADATRAQMDAQSAEDMAAEVGAGLLAEGWTVTA